MIKIKDILIGFSPYIIGAILLFSAYGSFKLYLKERREVQRLETNFRASMKGLQYYKSRSGREAARADVLQVRYDELKEFHPAIIAAIQDLRIKPSRVTQFSETHINTETRIKTILRDSIIYDTIKVRAFGYMDAWNTVHGHILDDSIQMDIWSRDSLIQVFYKGERYRPGWWIFSRRKLQQSASLTNPNAKIEYSKTIQIQKNFK